MDEPDPRRENQGGASWPGVSQAKGGAWAAAGEGSPGRGRAWPESARICLRIAGPCGTSSLLLGEVRGHPLGPPEGARGLPGSARPSHLCGRRRGLPTPQRPEPLQRGRGYWTAGPEPQALVWDVNPSEPFHPVLTALGTLGFGAEAQRGPVRPPGHTARRRAPGGTVPELGGYVVSP